MREITIKIKGDIDKYDIGDMMWTFKEFMDDYTIEHEILEDKEGEE